MIGLLPLTLVLFSWGPSVYAGSVNYGGACTVGNQKLEFGTYQFQSDCDSTTFCNSSGLCDHKGCRKDDFPFGYPKLADLPPKCDTGMFCPDEEDQCLQVLAVGSPCQFNRDDECEGPPNFKDLADKTGYGLNVNGSVCLNNICMWANATLGNTCVVENTAYTVYSANNESLDIVSRDNCSPGLYCDAQHLVCMQMKNQGESCDADKECTTFNCLASGVCGKSADKPEHVPFWVYIIVGVCILGGMIATLVGMYWLHRGHRKVEREKRLQYWREQNAFRQNILQMQETARHSIMSLPGGAQSQRSTMYSRDGAQSEDSQIPMLNPQSKSSALRHQLSDDGFDDGSQESIMIQRVDRKDPNRF